MLPESIPIPGMVIPPVDPVPPPVPPPAMPPVMPPVMPPAMPHAMPSAPVNPMLAAGEPIFHCVLIFLRCHDFL